MVITVVAGGAPTPHTCSSRIDGKYGDDSGSRVAHPRGNSGMNRGGRGSSRLQYMLRQVAHVYRSKFRLKTRANAKVRNQQSLDVRKRAFSR